MEKRSIIMETITLPIILLNIIPEAILLMNLGLILIGIKPDKKRVMVAGILQGIICYYVRKNCGFGIHIIVQYIFFVLGTWMVVRTKFMAAVVVNIIMVIVAILLEGSIGLVIPYITGITFGEMMSRQYLRILLSLPYIMILMIINYWVIKSKFTLEEDIKLLYKINGKDYKKDSCKIVKKTV